MLPLETMRVLFIVPYVPNLVRVRPYNLIRHLKARGCQVTVATLWSNNEERADAEALQEHCHRVIALPLPRWRSLWNCLRALPTHEPLQAVYCWSPDLARTVQSEIRNPQRTVCSAQSRIPNRRSAIRNPQFDIVHVEHLRGARYGLSLRCLVSNPRPPTTHPPPPVIWDSVDCISLLFEQALGMGPNLSSRLKAWLDLERTRRYEGRLVSQFDRVLVTSPVDKAALEKLAATPDTQYAIRNTHHASPNTHHAIPNTQQCPISILPNGVDLDYFTPADDLREPNTIVITGKMSYHANVNAVLHLVNDIMPRVWASRPDVKVLIVGKDPPRVLRSLQCRIPNTQSEIVVTGTVPDIRPYLRRATIAVATVAYGAGIQNKVLEAMACGTPLVATPQAVSALQTVNGQHLMVAGRSAAAFSDAVVRLLDDPALRDRLGREGRRYVESHHDWDTVVTRLEGIYKETVKKSREQRPPG